MNNIPAFPIPVGFAPDAIPGGGKYNEPQQGMTLQDYLVAAAVTGILANHRIQPFDVYPDAVADRAIEIARAVLNKRNP